MSRRFLGHLENFMSHAKPQRRKISILGVKFNILIQFQQQGGWFRKSTGLTQGRNGLQYIFFFAPWRHCVKFSCDYVKQGAAISRKRPFRAGNHIQIFGRVK
jgi:hypothetical protein